ncbi:carboxypeptidase-like regulatory domain-containing protein [Myroides sp. WP-1]|uniref:carboxypeptidase-like regulatory domain-containing protein n=1 Tax=Myroides sp. WP-1 TaxID=2759944 RepID=UPI0015F8B7B0|nr:carboxypeptidase-like regulatory domain-containing protein [Myroides sp. WP-1]MBB1138660.1 carboxypeptidase regulatory-like domain-containing protein [Myroides sp. WP-1]
MKKLFMFLAVAGLATFGASCSSSDDNGGGKDPQLTLKADKTSIKVDETVKFTVEVAGKAETGAELYKDGTKISNPYKFTEEGEFNIVAKKKGSLDSQAVKITVTKGGTENKKMTFTASSNEVGVGENVTFTIKDAEGNNIDGAKITLAGTEVSNPWKATAVGSFEFTAAKEGFDPAKVTVKVVKKITSIVLVVEDPENTTEDTGMRFSVVDQDGDLVTGSSIVIEGQPNPFPTRDGRLTITGAPEGTYKVHATYESLKSAVVNVVVKAGNRPTITGTVQFDGRTENVLEEVYGVSQVIEGEGGVLIAVWTTQTITESWVLQKRFFSVVELDEEENVIDGGIYTGQIEAFDIMIFSQSGGSALGSPERVGNEVAESANMAMTYKVTLGAGSSEVFDKVDTNNSITYSNGKNSVSTVSGDAQQVQWQAGASARGTKGGALKVGKPLLKAKY